MNRPTTKAEARRYCERVVKASMQDRAEPCEHGHFGCAMRRAARARTRSAAEFDLLDEEDAS
jgi:hypothetical protein